jgi:hypothetical protein
LLKALSRFHFVVTNLEEPGSIQSVWMFSSIENIKMTDILRIIGEDHGMVSLASRLPSDITAPLGVVALGEAVNG